VAVDGGGGIISITHRNRETGKNIMGLPTWHEASIIMVMRLGKGIGGTKKCRKFTALVDVYKTIAVVTAALSASNIPGFEAQHGD
jgi:hypothetical protein